MNASRRILLLFSTRVPTKAVLIAFMPLATNYPLIVEIGSNTKN